MTRIEWAAPQLSFPGRLEGRLLTAATFYVLISIVFYLCFGLFSRLAPEDGVVADPEAGADPDPEADRVTVAPSPDPAHDPDLVPPPSHGRPEDRSPSPRLPPDLVPDRDLGPDQEAPQLSQRGNQSQDPGLRALPSLLKKKEPFHPRKMVT